MRTLQDEWRDYRDSCYPEGVSALQNKECHQAFFAGCMSFYSLVMTLSELPDSEAEAALAKLAKEAVEICRARAIELKQPGNL